MRASYRRVLAVCAALGAPALTIGPVLAQQPVPDADLLGRQRQLFDQGNKLYDQNKLPEAEAVYLEAWSLKKSFDLAGNLGNLEADLKKWRLAAEHLAYAMREFPAGGRPAQRDELLKRLNEVKRRVGELRVQVSHPGAEVFVDGTSVGVAPIANELYVDPGTHVVEARLDGYPTALVRVTADGGRADEVSLKLVAKSANKVVLIAGGAAAGAAAIAGAAFLGVRASKASSASSLASSVPKGAPCPAGGVGATGTCADLKSALDAKAAWGAAGVARFVTAGASGAGTLVYGLVGGPRAQKSGLVVAPTVTAQGAGLWFVGSF